MKTFGTSAFERARENHRARQREGHRTPDWEELSDLMRNELIYREINLQIPPRD
jgi:hypothetical protein